MLHRFPLLMVAGALAIGLFVIVVLISLPVRAGPPPPVTRRDAASLRGSDQALTLTARAVDESGLVESRATGNVPAPPILAASPDGMTVAFSPVGPGQMGPLGLAFADGTQLEIALPGVRGAAFAPLGDWLAVVDLAGALWRVDAVTGDAARLADGPFGSDLTVRGDGRVVALHLSSVDAPIWAAAEIVDPDGGAIELVAGSVDAHDQLVYQAAPLLDGALLLARHGNDGGLSVVRVAADGSEALLTILDRGRIVDLSPGGDWLAWADGEEVSLQPIGTGPPPRHIHTASAARFSPDGSLLLLFRSGTAEVVDVAGNHLADVESSSCWFGDGRGCRP